MKETASPLTDLTAGWCATEDGNSIRGFLAPQPGDILGLVCLVADREVILLRRACQCFDCLTEDLSWPGTIPSTSILRSCTTFD